MTIWPAACSSIRISRWHSTAGSILAFTMRARTTDDVTEFLSDYGLDDDETVHSVFRAIVSDPASYLPYCIGYMEFKELRDDTEETMGDDFNLKEFHQCILNIGPCSFDVLEKYIQKDYIRT